MLPSEGVKEIYVILISIINYLRSLGKVNLIGEMVKKLLRSLPNIWGAKVMVI